METIKSFFSWFQGSDEFRSSSGELSISEQDRREEEMFPEVHALRGVIGDREVCWVNFLNAAPLAYADYFSQFQRTLLENQDEFRRNHYVPEDRSVQGMSLEGAHLIVALEMTSGNDYDVVWRIRDAVDQTCLFECSQSKPNASVETVRVLLEYASIWDLDRVYSQNLNDPSTPNNFDIARGWLANPMN
ncbi:MAG: hypothetical protein CMO81_05990 [Waddliaceae bacterium]|nr:hypothetical protein [Waddliaceae bacterium]